MEKNIFEYENKKVKEIHGVATATKTEKTIMNITIWIGFIGGVVSFILNSRDILPFYWIFIFIAVPFIPFTIFFIRHLVKKDFTIDKESYNVKGNYNNITKKDDVEISNYKYENLNNKDKGE